MFTAIRTVFAFSGSKKEHERYVKNLDDAKYYGIKKGFLNGVLMGFLWLAILCAYSVCKCNRLIYELYSLKRTYLLV